MLQESSFARQTRQPIFSLEAVRPRQCVFFAPLPVIFISQSLPPRPADSGSRRNQHAEPSPLVPFTRRGCVICESVRNLGIIFRVTSKENRMKFKKLLAVVFGSLLVLALSLPVMAQDTTQSTTTTTQTPDRPQTQTTQTNESTTKYKKHHKKVKKEKETTTTSTTPAPREHTETTTTTTTPPQ
jgi:hypothetical protein